MTDLNDAIDRKRIILQMHADVDAFCKREFEEDARTHLGASIIGHDCKAYGWNTFRWLKQEAFSGRMLRLFNRGHEEERRFVRWLQGAGMEVIELDPDTQKQFRIVGVDGHFGGSLDSMIKPAPWYELPPMIWLGEFKTHSEKSFTDLAGPIIKKMPDIVRNADKGKGVMRGKPQHYRQMCSYGRAYDFKFGLYCAVNKNTDELYFEIVPLDYRQADDLFRKAEGIIKTQTQPQKIAQTETFMDCKLCDYVGICHRGDLPDKNCRSCINAIPLPNAEWGCNHFQSVIPKDFIKVGCDNWKAIING